MDYGSLIAKRRARFDEIETAMSEPEFFSDQERSTALTREHQTIKKVLGMWEDYQRMLTELEDNRELAKGTDELAEMAAEEIPQLEENIERLGAEVQYALLPRDPSEERNALLEIRAGAGGDEASLFAGELLRLYQNYASGRGWKTQHLDSSPSDVGGFKEVVIKVTGEEVFRHLKYESGVHRVQRVPATETQGRIHTSTCTVAVMPEAQEVDIVLKPDELHIQATRSGGSGGQHVNTTDSAVQITHLPSGIQVKCQDGRSQTQNKALGLEILRSKLYEIKVKEEAEKHASTRRAQIGSGDRSEKIRTYNFPQSRVTDHRVNHTSHNMEGIMQGQIEEFTEALQKAEIEQKLADAESENENT
jgi:peptide chain release factor 1